MKVIEVKFDCESCRKKTVHHSSVIKDYIGPILKTFWCQHCQAAQVIRFCFVKGQVEIIEYLEASDIYVPRQPDIGITIRPKNKKRN
jgi:hypothetical protein